MGGNSTLNALGQSRLHMLLVLTFFNSMIVCKTVEAPSVSIRMGRVQGRGGHVRSFASWALFKEARYRHDF
jgi:hypothetical protein